jgi:glycosyltransferase involved in cell wall biosynthesis
MEMVDPGTLTNSQIALIIPTRNRPIYLRRLIQNLEDLILKPSLIIIVDSSEPENATDLKSSILDIHLIKSDYKSAAIQRNMGLDFFFETKEVRQFEFVSFLDDDIQVSKNYFELVIKGFNENPDCIGVSGIARNGSETRAKFRRNKLTDWIGITGNPGTLTRAVVNISPEGLKEKREVDWLIGCSTWRIEICKVLRFESDFFGQSIFEDVIFSARARRFGSLVFDPSIVMSHDLAIEGRENREKHYTLWLNNRLKIFSYNIPNLSISKFWILSFLLILSSALLSPFSSTERAKCVGLISGVKLAMRKRFFK